MGRKSIYKHWRIGQMRGELREQHLLSFPSTLIKWAGAQSKYSSQLAKAIRVCNRPQIHTSSVACPQDSPWPTPTPNTAQLTPRSPCSLFPAGLPRQPQYGLPPGLSTVCTHSRFSSCPSSPCPQDFPQTMITSATVSTILSRQPWNDLPPGLPTA